MLLGNRRARAVVRGLCRPRSSGPGSTPFIPSQRAAARSSGSARPSPCAMSSPAAGHSGQWIRRCSTTSPRCRKDTTHRARLGARGGRPAPLRQAQIHTRPPTSTTRPTWPPRCCSSRLTVPMARFNRLPRRPDRQAAVPPEGLMKRSRYVRVEGQVEGGTTARPVLRRGRLCDVAAHRGSSA
jgi:hypothetical protein